MAGSVKPTKKVLPSEHEFTPEPEANYLRVRVPELDLSLLTTPKVLLVLILFSYLLSGLLYMKLRSLEGGTGTGGGIPTVVGTSATNVTDAFIGYAKSAKMDTKKFSACLTAHSYADKITTDITDGTAAGVNATPGFIINGTVVIGAQPFSAFQAIIDQELSRAVIHESFGFIPRAYAQTTTTPSPAAKVTVANGHLPVLGKQSAKVTIVEFSDFQCPFCKQFFTNTFDQLKKSYIDTGKAKLYFRQYPLTSIHPNAQIAAEASECANAQGKFWQYHDILFTNQDAWVNLPQTQPSST